LPFLKKNGSAKARYNDNLDEATFSLIHETLDKSCYFSQLFQQKSRSYYSSQLFTGRIENRITTVPSKKLMYLPHQAKKYHIVDTGRL